MKNETPLARAWGGVSWEQWNASMIPFCPLNTRLFYCFSVNPFASSGWHGRVPGGSEMKQNNLRRLRRRS